MESNFMMPIGGKSILRSTGEEVEVIDSQLGERGARSDEDWVTTLTQKARNISRNILIFSLTSNL